LPFFLLEFTGLLQSKTDLICVTWLLSKDKIAQYQIYTNFLLLIQSAAGFIIAPFIKTIYRINSTSARKLSIRFFGLGILIAGLSVVLVDVFIQYFYHFKIELSTLIIGAFFIMPIFYYINVIYQLFKIHKQNLVVILNIAGVLISFILNIILIPLSKDGISGAIMAIAITQWLLLLIYATAQNRYSR
jgi:O-antigen/teichoic acid export membrane protein